MLIDDFLRNPAVKRALAAGEERLGKAVTQLLSSDRVMHGVQSVVASALSAKSTFDRGVRTAMQAVNLPTTDDVRELRERLAELEVMLDRIAARAPPAPPGAAGPTAGGGPRDGGEGA
jgi:hypothetical protein